MFEKGDFLTLSDDREYLVADLYTEGVKIYVYLIDVNDKQNVIFARLENDEINEIVDEKELEIVIRAVYNHIYASQLGGAM